VKHNPTNTPLPQQFHFRDPLTMANLILVLKDSFPELGQEFLEFEEADQLNGDEYDQGYFSQIFIPALMAFLCSDLKDQMAGKRIFHFLERMARSAEWPVVNVLGVVILESLPPKQLEVAKKYMGPKTKEVWKDLEEYMASLGAKK
jgi:hypothetical protein